MHELPHPFCSGWSLQPSKPYSLPSALLFILQNDERYTLGPGHYADSVWFLHASDCTVHLHHTHTHSYSDVNIIGSNCGTFGIIHAWQADANGDRCITLCTGCPSTTTDHKGALWAGSLDPWLI